MVSLALQTMRLATHPNLACMVIQFAGAGSSGPSKEPGGVIRGSKRGATGLDASLLHTPQLGLCGWG
jgi:hypothetical protein